MKRLTLLLFTLLLAFIFVACSKKVKSGQIEDIDKLPVAVEVKGLEGISGTASVDLLSDSEFDKAIDAVKEDYYLDDKAEIYAVDIKITDESGKEIKVGKPVTVSISIPTAKLPLDMYLVFHVHDGEAEELVPEVTANKLSITVNSFSPFVIIPKHVHSYGEWYTEREANCTEAKLEAHKCACGSIEVKEVGKPLGHDLEFHDIVAENCEEPGNVAYYTCNRCGRIFLDANGEYEITLDGTVVPALGHIDKNEDGTCDFCGKIIEEGSEHTHHFSDWEVFEPATCTKPGLEIRTCNCGEVEKREIPATGHVDEDKDGKCDNCGVDMGGELEPLYTMDGDYVYFGTYPQKEVTDAAIVSALNELAGTLPTENDNKLWTSYGYYIEDKVANFMWYIDLAYNGEKYRGVYFTKYRPSRTNYVSDLTHTHQFENGYEISKAYWFQYEPIKWRILNAVNNQALILSEMIIDSQPYYNGIDAHDGGTANNYANSTIRAWLNDVFYNTAFNEGQRALIKQTEIDNSAITTNPLNNPTYYNKGANPNACENTNDFIFLLSTQELTNPAYGFDPEILAQDLVRRKFYTDYTEAQGGWISPTEVGKEYDYNGRWWNRSPGYNGDQRARGVTPAGEPICDDFINSTCDGVAPALVINLGAEVTQPYETETYTKEGNYVYFGRYPQTRVTDSSLTNELDKLVGTLPTNENSQAWTALDYYFNRTNELKFTWYIDVVFQGEKYRGVYFTEYRSSSMIDYPAYGAQEDSGYIKSDENNTYIYWFKFEPIKWRILTTVDGNALLFSDLGIDCQAYNGRYNLNNDVVFEHNGGVGSGANYGLSDIRKWLNDTFYEQAFNSSQKKFINLTEVDNSSRSNCPAVDPGRIYNSGEENPLHNENACDNTFDYIFLISEQELTTEEYGFADFKVNDPNRQIRPTDYSICQGAITENGFATGWLTRSAENVLGGSVMMADCYGKDYGFYTFCDDPNSCVVPLLWINLSE